MKRCIYHVGPWRRAIPWMVFGPMLVLAASLWVFADSVGDRSVGALIFAILTLLVLGLHALISYARLELTAEGVRLRQIGMNLAAGFRLRPSPGICGTGGCARTSRAWRPPCNPCLRSSRYPSTRSVPRCSAAGW